jgi:YD repeat-containing protein
LGNSYDARGNLVSVDRDINGTNYATGYAYNGADRLIQITYPSGMVIDYTLDAAGRVIAVDKTVDQVTENLVTGVTYEPFGPVSAKRGRIQLFNQAVHQSPNNWIRPLFADPLGSGWGQQ